MFSTSSVTPAANLRTTSRAVFHRRARLADANNTEVPVKTLDIGEDGCGFLIQQPLREDQHFTLTIFTDSDGKLMEITAKGKILNCSLMGMKGYRAGMHFTHVDSPSKDLIKSVVERSAKLF